MLNVMSGYDAADATSARWVDDDCGAQLRLGVRGLRIGVPRGYFFDQLEAGIADALEVALAEFARQGAQLCDVAIPGIADGVGGVFGFVLAEAQEIHAKSLRERPEDFGSDLRALLAGAAPPTSVLMQSLRACDELTVAMRTALQDVDVLVTPTTPIVAAPIGAESVRYGGVDELVLMAMIRCTAPFNATHLPALSLPCGFNTAGLPIGMQIAGRPFDEAMLLRVGHAYEQATDWHLRTPKL